MIELTATEGIISAVDVQLQCFNRRGMIKNYENLKTLSE